MTRAKSVVGRAGCLDNSSMKSTCMQGWREQPPRGPPWVSGLVGHFVQTWPDSECSHTVQCLDCSDMN